jgi:hypothetical protein
MSTTINVSIDGDSICTVYCDEYRVLCNDYGTHELFVIEACVNEKVIAIINVDEYYD